MPNDMPLCFTFAYEILIYWFLKNNNIFQKLYKTQTSIALLTAFLNTDKTQ